MLAKTLRLSVTNLKTLQQLEVQEITRHMGVVGPVSIPFLTLIKEMLRHHCLAPHSCFDDKYCTKCDLTITFFQLVMNILAYLLPLLAIQNNRVSTISSFTTIYARCCLTCVSIFLVLVIKLIRFKLFFSQSN